MATLALSLAGQFVGGAVAGPIGATIGRALGALAGAAIDDTLFGDKPEPRMGADIRLTGSSEGGAIPRLYGWSRMAGNIVWATELEELTDETTGAKGLFQPQGTDGQPVIAASFAVAFCEGEVSRLGRVWADGHVLETASLTLRFYGGSETQEPDSLIEAVQGEGNAPAYRGLCYIVFERLPLTAFGNRIPNIQVELCRVAGELEPQIRSINVIPGAGEFVYDPAPRVRLVSPGVTASENTHLSAEASDWTLSIDELRALCPNLENVSLVIAWFGDDLRCNHCSIAPRTEGTSREIAGTSWSVAGLTRDEAQVASLHEGGLAYGGTPSDGAVLAAIADLKARGLGVTLYPLIMMDIAADNPMGQPAYPWRGRITCDPAPGALGSPDGTATAAAQVASFVPGFRDFVLHHADLAAAAGGVDAIVIGSEMRGLTTVRGADDSFPFVEALVALADDVRDVVGPGCKLTYAADWSEATGYQPGGGAKYFHLDPLWAADAIDAIGIDNYMPIADWRDGTDHADAADRDSTYDLDYLRAGITGGEGHDWYYASDADRVNGVRSAITDGAHGEPWVWRFKDLAGWWLNAHHDRPGGVRDASPTAWAPGSKPIWFTELGCGAVDKGANQPSAFGDPKSAEDARPHFSSGAPDPLMQRQFLRAHFAHWASDANPRNGDGEPMVDVARITPWAWDARPYPAFPVNRQAWSDGPNYATGHWLNGRLGGLASDEAIRAIASDYGIEAEAAAAGPLLHGLLTDGVISARDAVAPASGVAGLGVRDTANGLAFARVSERQATMIARDDVVAGDGPLISRRRPDPSEAVAQVAVSYFDRERDYLAASATAMRPESGSMAGERLPLVLDTQGARRAAERLLTDGAAQRETLDFSLPPSRAALEVGDAVAIEGQGDGPFEITQIRDGEVRRISARAIPPVLDAAIATDGPRAIATSEPVARVTPLLVAAHLPPDPAAPTGSRLLLAAYASPWPGRVPINDDATGTNIARLDRPAVMGELLADLAAGPAGRWDMANAIECKLFAGHLASADEHAVLAGTNRLAVLNDAGDWEIVGFAEAALVAPSTYRLSRLLRGLTGTDHAIATASAGNRVVVLDGRMTLAAAPAAWLGTTVPLVAYAGASDPTGSSFDADLRIAPLIPLSPVHLRGSRDAEGDIVLTWLRRSRADTDGWATVDAPADALAEAYRVTIQDGPDAVRVIDVSVPAATYTAAEQIDDFGSPPESFGFAVSQLSPVHGAGHPAYGEFDA